MSVDMDVVGVIAAYLLQLDKLVVLFRTKFDSKSVPPPHTHTHTHTHIHTHTVFATVTVPVTVTGTVSEIIQKVRSLILLFFLPFSVPPWECQNNPFK